jgi:transposase
MNKKEDIETISRAEIAALIERVESNQLREDDRDLTLRLLLLLYRLLGEIDDKKASIGRLRKLLFGPKSEKRKKTQKQQSQAEVNKEPSDEPSVVEETAQSLSKLSPVKDKATPREPIEKKIRPGHGRLSASDFPAAAVVLCPNTSLKPGSECPNEYCKGRLRDTNEPQILIKREARPIIDAIRYERQVLRCRRCEERFVAKLPENVTEQKYDASADVMIAILHYSCALPFSRLEQIQSNLGVPLPASTQFERAEVVANNAHPVFLELERLAAKSGLLHTDDTSVRILSLIKENKELSQEDRRGMYTTGIGARSAEFDIVLYRSGRMYSSENLDQLMIKRPDDLTEFILMADAENKNWSKKFSAIIAKCLAHARRKFVDCESVFRTECEIVLDHLGEVYKIDTQTKNMTPLQRLAHHQQYSKPIMEELKQYMDDLINVDKKEPNSALGKAIRYMNNHWSQLMRFLEVAGCPLDNNFIERCLRKAVILRKNSLFFKTEHGAQIGDVLTSIIGTCNLNNVNPFHYLITLMKNKKDVRSHPQLWLPWNYQRQQSKTA